jgi:hypothetical protein
MVRIAVGYLSVALEIKNVKKQKHLDHHVG